MQVPIAFLSQIPQQGQGIQELLALIADQGRTREATALASAARTTATTSAALTNHDCRGIMIFLNVSAASGTGGLTLQVSLIDPISGNTRTGFSAAAAVTATGTSVYLLYPAASLVAPTETKATALPRTFKIAIAVGDSSSYTYSVGYCLLL